ncbi:12634_t:CDS:2 [Funneliformis mosseae]|uniref:12634_t:CDS:1 n=1 Tax=Funneliformis mosseae TaxID=27381 RepID=A0A9N9HXI3_FUNMO|nr:12634_t:CDS:2 [Funneliformis mosseae]
MSTDTIELFCLIQENTVAQAFPLKIDQNESIGQLKEVIKVKKTSESNFFAANRIQLWKIQIQGDSDKELTKLILYKEEQLLLTRKVSSYFSEKPLDERYCRISRKDFYYKATLRGCCLYCGDRQFSTFTKFIQTARKKLDEQLKSYHFHELIINGMTYLEVCEKIYKMIFCNYDEVDDDVIFEEEVIEFPMTYDDETWCVCVVTRNLFRHKKIEKIRDQIIRFIPEEEGFVNAEILSQNPHDPLPTWKKVSKDLQKSFNEALDNKLGPSFCETHYNLVGMSTGYKRTQGKFTEIPAIILYVRQKSILRRGCVKFPDEIHEYLTDVVKACIATPCGFSAINYQSFQEEVKLGRV